MEFASPLIPARLLKRHKRFLADVILDTGEFTTAFCPNTGAMTGLTTPGTKIWLSRAANPARKYALTWELAEVAESGLTGVNTHHPNRIVAEAIAAGRVPQLAGYDSLRHEVRLGDKSRLDLLLEGQSRAPCYVEIKNVHFFRTPHRAEFPDCPTARGLRHINDMKAALRKGHRAVMVYLIQSGTAQSFGLAADIDPDYFSAFKGARKAGVEVIALACRVSTREISVDRHVPVDI